MQANRFLFRVRHTVHVRHRGVEVLDVPYTVTAHFQGIRAVPEAVVADVERALARERRVGVACEIVTEKGQSRVFCIPQTVRV